MSEAIDIQARLGQLNNTVRAGQIVKQSQKRDDWSRVERECPEQAEHIAAMAAAFGKPERVRVKNAAGELILDSNRYK